MQNAMPLNLADVREKPASAAELTSEQFVRGVALALRAQWEGVDLEILRRSGFRIVRNPS